MDRKTIDVGALLGAVILAASSARRSVSSSALAEDSRATAHYLANAGVLVTCGETKIVFDPLFRNGFGVYQLLPESLERALFEGAPPFDGLDARHSLTTLPDEAVPATESVFSPKRDSI